MLYVHYDEGYTDINSEFVVSNSNLVRPIGQFVLDRMNSCPVYLENRIADLEAAFNWLLSALCSHSLSLPLVEELANSSIRITKIATSPKADAIDVRK